MIPQPSLIYESRVYSRKISRFPLSKVKIFLSRHVKRANSVADLGESPSAKISSVKLLTFEGFKTIASGVAACKLSGYSSPRKKSNRSKD